jgi:hypothetical protein
MLLPNLLKDRSWANLMLGQAPIIVLQLRQEVIPTLERARLFTSDSHDDTVALWI